MKLLGLSMKKIGLLTLVVGVFLIQPAFAKTAEQLSEEDKAQEEELVYKIKHRLFVGGQGEGELKVQLYLPPIVRKMNPLSEAEEESSASDD